jgi:hypothetical protein
VEGVGELTERERAMLLFCRRWWHAKGSQEVAIREEFGVSPTRFWQEVRALVTRQEAVAFAPDVCRRYAPRRGP